MAMWLANFESEARQPLARIDLTPVIGVLAALLVVTVGCWPRSTHDVSFPLPMSEMMGDAPPPVELLIDMDGTVIWEDVRLLPGEFENRLAQFDRRDFPPQLHVRVPRALRYEYLVDVAEAARRHKLHIAVGEL